MIFAHAEKIDNAIGIDTNLDVICDKCGRTHKTIFKAGPEFFRPEVDI